MSKGLKIILIILLILFIVGAGTIYLGWRFIGGIAEEGPEGLTEMFEKYEDYLPFDLPEDIEDLEDFEDLYEEPVEDPVETPTEEENPYDLAKEVAPMTEDDQKMDANIKRVLGEVFEKEPKLVETAIYYNLTYIVDRVIIAEDIQEIGNLFQEDGFKTEDETKEVSLTRSQTGDESYSLEFDVEGKKFTVIVSTTKEGEDAQLVRIRM